MKALKYKLERLHISASNVLTEFVNNTLNTLNENEPVAGDSQPYWELGDTVSLGDELLFIFTCWQDRNNF